MPTGPDDTLPYRPTVDESTLGWVYGWAATDRVSSASELALPALRRVVLESVSRGPCLVAFSGGRDSSTVLAVAVDIARRHGLPLPVPVTLRYPHLPETDERGWQEAVVRQLALPDWIVVELDSENGLTGPYAAEMLALNGPYFPFAAHTSLPIAREAAGGTVLTGEGGDLVLSPHRTWALANVVHRRGRVEPAAWRAALRGLGPGFVRARRSGRDAVAARPWLTPMGTELARKGAASDARREPLSWPAATRVSARLRALSAGLATVRAAYRLGGANVRHPLLAEEFVAALAASYGPLGPLSRGRVIADLAGDLLPAGLAVRSDKSDFTRAVVTPDVHRLVDEWNGVDGVDSNLVDPARLRAEWRQERPSALSLQLLLEVVHATRHVPATS